MALDLTGVMVATVTPFTRGGAAVDHDWIPPHLRFLEQAGISSVFTLGTNGEGPSVGVAERRQVVETVVAHQGGLGVVAGAGTAALPDTIRAANDALEAGADAVAILPPFFEAQVDSAGLLGYFDAVLEALPAPGRVLLYNIPHKAQVDIPDDVVLALLDLHGERVIGIKDSSGVVERTSRYLAIAERFPHVHGAGGRRRASRSAVCGRLQGRGDGAGQRGAAPRAWNPGGAPERPRCRARAAGAGATAGAARALPVARGVEAADRDHRTAPRHVRAAAAPGLDGRGATGIRSGGRRLSTRRVTSILSAGQRSRGRRPCAS